ncbi:subtilisin-like protein [Mycena latifolia]|nr:subtilisin-like protein [Mycena latifolia]
MLKLLTFSSLLFAIVHSEFLVLEKRDDPPVGFSRVGPAPVDQVLNLHLALTQRDITGLHDTVYEISTPRNARYGQYLTQDEVEQFVSPSEETVSQVNSWLSSHNLTSAPVTSAGDWVSVNMTVSQANALLVADFSTFQNQETNQTVVRTLSYSIPSFLEADISWVHPTVNFPSTNALGLPSFQSRAVSDILPKAPVSADCRVNSSWTPVCLQELYGIPSAPAEPVENLFGVSGFGNQFANKRDLKLFLETYRPDMNPNTTFDFISVDDGINNQLPAGAGVFADPNMQYAVGLATGVPVTFISTGSIANDLFTELLDHAHYLLSLKNPPQTILNAFGAFGVLESQVSPQIASSICDAFAQLAARGVSYIVDTGSWGAGGSASDSCVPFDPPFPATCPFVTAVGATLFNTAQTEETSASFSGGGFSRIFKRPGYQDTAVDGYLESTGNTQSTAFDVSGRAVPDVSALCSLTFIQDVEIVNLFLATGYGAGVFASVVALLTNERIAAGKPGLGFINPLLYQNPSAFNDITAGNNPGFCSSGFNTTTGWDPVSGFGSPNYPALQEASNKL